MATTIRTLTGDAVSNIITELTTKGKYPLYDNAEKYTPAWKSEPITRIDLVTWTGDSLQATPEAGGYELKGYGTQSDVSYSMLRGSFPLSSTPMAGTSEETFWKQNGLDTLTDLIRNSIECEGIASVQAAVTATSIQNETAHIVGGANTTFDAMTDAQLIAYLNHVYLTLINLRVPVLPDRMVFATGRMSRFMNLLNGVKITSSGGTVSIDTTVKVLPEVEQLLTTGLEEDYAVSYSGYKGARTGANPWSTAAFMYSTKAGNQTMRYSEWNQQLGPKEVPMTHTSKMVLEIDKYLALTRLKGCFYITSAFA